MTEGTGGKLLGHGVYTVDGTATGRFTAYGDAMAEVDALVSRIRDSPLTESVWETDDPHVVDVDATVPGNASTGIVVRYAIENSINDALVSRGFIPDEPVRMHDGREYWTVLVDESRQTVQERIDDIESEMAADIDINLITSSSSTGTGVLQTTDLSERQREVFELARQRNYYTWPREVTASQLSEELGISKATLLEHLRKAEAKILGGD